MHAITSNESVVLLALGTGILPFPLKRDIIDTFRRFGKPAHGSEDEGELGSNHGRALYQGQPFQLKRNTIDALPRFGKPEHRFDDEDELATPLVSKSVPRCSDHLSGVFRCRIHQRGVNVVFSTRINNANDTESDDGPMSSTSPHNWRSFPLPLEQDAHFANIVRRSEAFDHA
ncbi:uncharacterized protein FOMMEDRAFT_160516 [Fomitiporia mediterranea MF3/22]|uniref:uncharacterized protein n=1 Tax=Fomitiporia mediterranea (strain MF3/22) TaxID=694068 RepID=UPI0004407445|nr:uncharacterized protein FOMMEDRAFT_160516 [Fomitiporia mediterranea MF3/22]EJC99462.1 hypothetical protein FOMMEDRAFT_160516 [Fomitiporia mediterranea MF3/22]